MSLVTLILAATTLLGCADEDVQPRRAERPQSTRVELTPVVRGARAADQQPIFYPVEVHDGDTVEVLAARFGVRPEYIRWNNPGLPEGGVLARGTLVAIPSKDGIIHEVQPGETLSSIAARYGVSMAAIIDEPSNGLGAGRPAPSGGTLLIPDGRPPAP